MSIIMNIGLIGTIICNHVDNPNGIANNIFMTLLAVGLLGTAFFTWMKQRAKSKGNGKRAVYIASTVYLVFIVILCAWAVLEKLGIL